jgi:hypothetical protein
MSFEDETEKKAKMKTIQVIRKCLSILLRYVLSPLARDARMLWIRNAAQGRTPQNHDR